MWGRTTLLAYSLGETMAQNRATSNSMNLVLDHSAEWSKCDLEVLVAEGISRYRIAAATARRAYDRWRCIVNSADNAEQSLLLEQYRLARATCAAERVALNHVINQLGYIPKAPTSA